MHHAGLPRSVAVSTTTSGPSHAAPHRSLAQDNSAASHAETQLVLDREDTLSGTSHRLAEPRPERFRQLAITIRQRIESRLAGRIRDLAVRVRGDAIVLEGRCATYYSKQLAQHAALGVLDGEQLENAIVVTM